MGGKVGLEIAGPAESKGRTNFVIPSCRLDTSGVEGNRIPNYEFERLVSEYSPSATASSNVSKLLVTLKE